jgi:hypothetical protein
MRGSTNCKDAHRHGNRVLTSRMFCDKWFTDVRETLD